MKDIEIPAVLRIAAEDAVFAAELKAKVEMWTLQGLLEDLTCRPVRNREARLAELERKIELRRDWLNLPQINDSDDEKRTEKVVGTISSEYNEKTAVVMTVEEGVIYDDRLIRQFEYRNRWVRFRLIDDDGDCNEYVVYFDENGDYVFYDSDTGSFWFWGDFY